MAIALVTGALASAATGWRREGEARPAGLWFALSGLLLGLAVHARVDAILALPAIAFWTLGATRRPWANLALLALGLAPGLIGAAALNWMKFGLLNPLSYGRDGSGSAISVGYYARLLPLGLAAVLAAVALSLQPVRRLVYRPGAALGLLALAPLAALMLPGVGELLLRIWKGAAVLFVNLELFPEMLAESGMVRLDDGTILYYGWAKKALLQSMPYAAVAVLLLPALFRGPHRAGVALGLMIVGAVLLPFALSAWIGGRANHMRYLLMAAPALVLLSALAMRQIAGKARGALPVAVGAGVLVVLAGVIVGLLRLPDPVVMLQRSIPNVLVLAIALLAVAALLSPPAFSRTAHAALRGTVAAGVVVAAISAWVLDFAAHQKYRADNRDMAVAVRALPERALFNTLYPTFAYERIGRDGTLLATTHALPARFDPALVAQALADGLPVYVQHPEVAQQIVDAGLATGAEQVTEGAPWYQLYRLVAAEPPS